MIALILKLKKTQVMARSKKIKSMADTLTKGKVAVGRYSFSKLTLITFALVFAAIGGFFLYKSFAAYSPNRYVYCLGDPNWFYLGQGP